MKTLKQLLKDLDEAGVGYCSEKAFKENIMGIDDIERGEFKFEDVMNMNYEIIKDLHDHYVTKSKRK